MNNKRIAELLVETGAYTDLDKPVILTSGELGIYYINTEKLAQDNGEFNKYGSSSKKMIDHAVAMAKAHPTFEEVIEILAEDVEKLLKGKSNCAVSGGQRRDWLFSGPVAKKLGLPHISLYKDISDKGLEVIMPDGSLEYSLYNFNVVHIADLLTEASSCCKQPEGWIPQLRAGENNIKDLVSVVTRLQGGEDNLKKIGVTAHCQVAIDENFLRSYSKNPDQALDYQADTRLWTESYLINEGALAILNHFDPKAGKMDRVRSFLVKYGPFLDMTGKRKEELKKAVVETYHKNNYIDQLKKSSKDNNSIVCMGLDPVITAMPEKYSKLGITGVIPYFQELFYEMKSQKILPGAFKPNQGFYLRHDKPHVEDFSGSKTLANVIEMIKDTFPRTPIILDFKRGDIATSSANYAAEAVDTWRADAMTVAPYMGSDSTGPFIDTGKGVYILNRTSNKGAVDLQDLKVDINDQHLNLYEVVANKIVEWAEFFPGVGAVVGATYPEELRKIAKIYTGKNIPLLIPGVGGQGGRADEVISRLKDVGYDLSIVRINSSSGLTHPWKEPPVPEDYVKICVNELYKLNKAIGKID